MFKKDELHIVYAADDKFVEIMGISMLSLFHNNTDMKEIHTYLLDSRISKKNKENVEQICRQYQRTNPQWIKAKNIKKELNMDVITDRGSISQYARLFLSAVLPPGLERVLYLDCDVIINQSVGELWNLDLHGNTIGALMDAFSRQYRANIDLQPGDVMFNSGVMLIDLCRWKEKRIEDKLRAFIIKKHGKIQQGDQGALNAVLVNDTYCFEPRFNAVTIFFDFNYEEMMTYRKPPEFYSREQIEQAVENPVLIHYTTSFLSRRPWQEGCRHRYLDKWLEYKALSPWKDDKLWSWQEKKGLVGSYTALVKMMPRRMGIWVSGIVQAYGRPWIFKIKYRLSKRMAWKKINYKISIWKLEHKNEKNNY